MEIQAFIRPIRRWWWLIVSAMILGATFSYLAVRNEPLVYQSRTTLFSGRAIDDPNPTGSDFVLSQQLARAYADIGQRAPVHEATMKALGLNRLPQVVVRNPPNTALVEIVVVDTDPERSQAVANEMANQLIRLSPSAQLEEEQSRQNFIQQQLADMEEQIVATETEIGEQEAELANAFSAQQIADAEAQINALQNKLNTLRENYAALLSSSRAEANNTLTIIEPATLPSRPVGPNVTATILAATGISLAVATAAAYLLEYLDDRVRNPDDVERAIEVRPVAAIHTVDLEKGESPLVAKNEPSSAAVDSFRALNTLLEVTHDGAGHTILVTSPGIRDGKSFVAANLAIVMAQAGWKVLLIDADLLRPVQHRLFELPNEYGLKDVLTCLAVVSEMNGSGEVGCDDGVLERAIQRSDNLGLDVMVAGSAGSGYHNLMTVRRIDWLFERLAEKYQVIVLDGPPVLAVSNSSLLSSRVERTLFLVNAKGTRRSELRQAIEQLHRVFANIVVILNHFAPSVADYAYYYRRLYHDVPVKSAIVEDKAESRRRLLLRRK